MQFIGLIFLIGLVLEIVSIVLVGKLIGGLATFALMILSAMLGSYLLRNMANVSKVILAGGVLKNGGVSMYELLLPIRVPLAGILLMIPGFLTDILALVLLFPFQSKNLAQAEQHAQHFTSAGFQYGATPKNHNDDVIEGDFVVRDENGKNPSKNPQNDVIEHR